MNCQETTKTTTPSARFGFAEPVLVAAACFSPVPSPKLGSSRALKVIAIAAELSSSGMKYRTARTSR